MGRPSWCNLLFCHYQGVDQFESMEHFTKILPNGTVQIPPNMLKDLGFEPGMSIELHTTSDVLEVRPALKQSKANIYFGCMKDQIVMHDDLIAPTDVDWYS